MIKRSPFRYFKISLKFICLAVMIYVRLPLSFSNVEDLRHERGIEISHQTAQFRRNTRIGESEEQGNKESQLT